MSRAGDDAELPLTERWIRQIKNRPVFAVVILASILLVGLAQTTDALVKLRTFIWPSPTYGGAWKYELHSNVSGATITGTMDLLVSGDSLSGEMENPDPQRRTERSPVSGRITDQTVILARTTNRAGVTQEYRLQRQGDALVGTFSNLGQQPGTYFADNGQFRMYR